MATWYYYRRYQVNCAEAFETLGAALQSASNDFAYALSEPCAVVTDDGTVLSEAWLRDWHRARFGERLPQPAPGCDPAPVYRAFGGIQWYVMPGKERR